MSTRSTIHFIRNGNPHRAEAIIYKHTDGYPDGVWGNKAVIATFLRLLRDKVQDTRFGDPSYLAAKFVVFIAAYYAGRGDKPDSPFARRSYHPLAFLSVGVMDTVPSDVEWCYYVSDECDDEGFPLVSVKRYEARGTFHKWESIKDWGINEELYNMFDLPEPERTSNL